MTGFVLKGGTVLTPDGSTTADVYVRGDRIVSVGADLASTIESAEVFDISGLVVGPGLVDLHTHLREPGQEWKEDIASGSQAAAAGGYTAVVAMPNTDPPTDTGHLARYIRDRGREVGLVDVEPAGCITAGMSGTRLARLDEMVSAGVRIFTDDGNTVADAGLLRRAMEYLGPSGALVAQHAEDPGLGKDGHMHEGRVSSVLGIEGIPALAETVVVARDLALAELTGATYHVQHVSCAQTLDLLADAIERKVKVTAEVTPHHLWFTHQDVLSMDPVTKMYPPLRTNHDVQALRAGLRQGLINLVGTDHAPHASQEKDVPFEDAPRGVTGLETALAAVRSALDADPRLVFERMSVAPARIAALSRHGNWVEAGKVANLVVVDWDDQWVPTTYASKSTNSLFTGIPLKGRIHLTCHDGKLTYRSDGSSRSAG